LLVSQHLRQEISLVRLYCPHNLFLNLELSLDEKQIHYLRHVLRATVGHRFNVFNERDGEWLAEITALAKAEAEIKVISHLRPATLPPDISLVFALIKHDPLSFLIEKATELGVRQFYPITTDRCNISRLNEDRLKSNILDASQQCERFDIPTLHPLNTLKKTLSAWLPAVPLFVCQERGEAAPLLQKLSTLSTSDPIGFLIGPEGGLSEAEMAVLNAVSFTRFVKLGSRILRAETAALSAVACYQAFAGDWKV